MVSQHGLKHIHLISVCAVDKLQSWVFQKLKAWCPRASTCSDETNPFVVRAVRRQIHSFILGTGK